MSASEIYRPLTECHGRNGLPSIENHDRVPKLIGISVTGREAGGDVAQEMPGLVSSLSRKCRSSFCLPPELLAAIFLEYARDSASLMYSVTVPRWIAVPTSAGTGAMVIGLKEIDFNQSKCRDNAVMNMFKDGVCN